MNEDVNFDLNFLRAGGDMGRRVLALDWGSTSLGPIEDWPVPLLAATKVMLLTRLPMYIAWGPDLTVVYNDAYAATIPERHPASLGKPLRQMWKGDAWVAISSEIESALEGHSSFIPDRPHPLGCTDKDAETYFTYCTVPLSDETGRVRGVFCSGYETTAEVRTRNAYRADSERLRDLFDQAPGFVVVLNGPDHVHEIVNEAYFRLVGHRDLVGRPVREALPEIEGQGYFELLDRVYATGKRHVATEVPIRLRRGADRPEEERFVTFVYQPITDVQGAITGIFVEGSDVTAAVRAARSQKESERLAQATIDALGEHIAVIDADGIILAVNDAWRVFAEANGGPPMAVCEHANYLDACDRAAADHDAIAGDVACLIREVAAGTRDTAEIEYPCHSPTEQRWFQLKITRFRNEGPTRIVVAHENVTERRKSEERIQYLATHDALTGLPNRSLLEDRAQQVIEHARRTGLGVALLFLDLDNFKYFNDAYGHGVGDEMLVAVASELESIVGIGDTISRLGGDEFAILLADLGDSAIEAESIARAITQRFGSPLPLDDRDITVTASIGISVYPGDGEDLEDLLRNADAAMYRAKESGRFGYQFYAAEMSARSNERVLLENELRRAIRQDQLSVIYQPQIDMRTGRPIGVEALVRWKHPELGAIPPDRFIPVAEEAGLIVQIGRFVLKTACLSARTFQRIGLPPIGVAVNVSVAELRYADFVDTVDDVLSETGLDPSLLELEITEGIMMDGSEALIGRLQKLRALGVRLAIDDFGTGYSNLAYLKAYPIGRLKIDRGFVSELTTDHNAVSIARAILALGESLGLHVLAEGVETDDQVRTLLSMGCKEAQGFLYSHPMPEREAGSWLREAFGQPVSSMSARNIAHL